MSRIQGESALRWYVSPQPLHFDGFGVVITLARPRTWSTTAKINGDRFWGSWYRGADRTCNNSERTFWFLSACRFYTSSRADQGRTHPRMDSLTWRFGNRIPSGRRGSCVRRKRSGYFVPCSTFQNSRAVSFLSIDLVAAPHSAH